MILDLAYILGGIVALVLLLVIPKTCVATAVVLVCCHLGHDMGVVFGTAAGLLAGTVIAVVFAAVALGLESASWTVNETETPIRWRLPATTGAVVIIAGCARLTFEVLGK